LELLDVLDLTGSIVTADALHCTRAFAAAVQERGGNYALVVKANRGPLFKSVMQQLRGRDSAAAPNRSNARPTIGARLAAQRLSAIPAWPAAIAFPALRRSAGSHCADVFKGSVPTHLSFAIMSSPNTCPRKGFCRSVGAIGAPRTVFIGSSTSISPRTAIGRGKTTRPRTWPFCESLHSTSCKQPQTRLRYAAKSSAQAGTTPAFCRHPAICDSPARNGVPPLNRPR
jgi:hypothetical protein